MTSSENVNTPEFVSSAIQSVVLFSNQAQVTRTAKTKLQKGLREILLDVQAYNVDVDSVSAKVFGEGEIYSVQYREICLPEPPQENIRMLDKKIEEKVATIKRLKKNLSVIDQRDHFIGSVAQFSQTEIPKELKTAMPNVEQWEATLGFIEKNAAASNEARQNLELQIQYLQKYLDVLQSERNSLCSGAHAGKRVIEILFHSAKDQEISLEASYIVYDAGWQPYYKINIPLELEATNLTLFSRIVQQTGEDWLAANLSISNVIPMQGIGLPDQGTWILDVCRPAPAPRSMAKRRAMGALTNADDDDMEKLQACREEMPVMAAAAPEPEADFMESERTELPLAFEYKLPQALDIESQDKETILPLFTKSVPGDYFYRVVPQASPLAFLVCRAQADSELLSGYLNVYFGSRYIGKTFLSEKKPGEDFIFSLGADRQIKVKRENKTDKVKETLLGMVQRQSIVRDLAYTITLENLKDKPVKLEILDSIPVSRTDKIEVKDLALNPKPTTEQYQNRAGVLQWLLELAPGEKKEITIAFTVVYPKSPGIVGL